MPSQPPDRSDKHLTKQTLVGFKWSGLASLLQGILQVVVISALAHLLSPREFGLFGIALIFLTFAERLGQLGVGPALVQLAQITDRHQSIGFSLSLGLGFLICGLFWLLSPSLVVFFGEPELALLLKAVGGLFIIDSLGVVPESLMQRHMRFKELLVINAGTYTFGNGLVAISMAWAGFGVWSLVAGAFAGRFIKVACLLVLEPQRPTLRFEKVETAQLLKLGVGFTLGRVLNYAALQGDNFVVGRMLGADSLGLYSRAYQLMTLPATYIGQVMEKVLFPAMAQRQSARERLVGVYLLGVECVALVAMPMSVFLFVAAPEVVYVLLGDKWNEVVPVLKILSLGVFFRTAYKNGDTLVTALGAVYRHALRQAVYTCLVIGGAIYGSQWGLEGVAWAVLVAVVVNYLTMCLLSAELLKLSLVDFIKSLIPALWISSWLTVALSPVLSLTRENGLSPYISLLVVIFLSGLVCVLATFFSPKVTRSNFPKWAIANMKLEKLGKYGKFAERVLLWIGK